MRKSILLMIVGSFIMINGFSQVIIKPTAGINITDFSKVPGGEAKGKLGWQLGGSVAFGKKLYFEPGIFFVGKSSEFSYSDLPDQEFKADIKGFRIPVNIGYKFVGDEKTLFGLRGFGGASAFFISDAGDIDMDAIKKSSFGIFAGAGIDIWKLFLDLSYEWSLTNLQKDVSEVEVGKSRSLFISAGFRIALQ